MENHATSGLSEDYVEGLNRKLLVVRTDYNIYAKAATKAGREHAQAVLYHNDLKAYCQQVSSTYVKIGDAYTYLGTLLNHAREISSVLDLSHQSLNIFARFLKCMCEDVESLLISIRALIKTVDGIGDGILNAEGAMLLKCLKELEAEVVTATNDSCVAIGATIDLYRCLLDLTYGIGIGKEDPATGLINDFQQMLDVLCCGYSAGIGAQIEGCNADDPATTDSDAELAQCCPNSAGVDIEHRECDLAKPATCGGNLFGNAFFRGKITDSMEEARKLVETKKCVLRYYEKKRAGAQAKMEAIGKALDAANKAKALCK